VTSPGIAKSAAPDFFMVGAPKCGTTALAEYLRRHPDLFLPDEKELHFFGSDLQFRENAIADWQDYLDCFADRDNEARVGEASVMYLYSKRAAREIAEHDPNAQIIVMLRDPVEMLYSFHSQLVSTYDETILDFASALEAEEDRARGRRIPETATLVDFLLYRQVANFAPQLRRYFDVFGRERVHVILYEDFAASTEAVYRATLRFLGVEEDFATEFEPINVNTTMRNRRVGRVLRRPPSWMRTVARTLMPLDARRSFRAALMTANARPGKRPPMDPAVREQLADELRPGVDALGEMLGRDLSHWCKPKRR